MNIIEKLKRKVIEGVIVIEKLPESTGSEVAAKRQEVCNGCEYRTDDNTCSKCGCLLDIKTKTYRNYNPSTFREEITHCPLGKWGDADIALFYRKLKSDKS